MPGEGTGFQWPCTRVKEETGRPLKRNAMTSSGGKDDIQASVMATDSKQNVVNLNSDLCSRGRSGESSTPVFVELLRQIPPLRSEDPEAILNFCVQIEEVFELGLVDDRSFVMRVLPLVSGSVLRFLEIACGLGTVGPNVRAGCWKSIFHTSFANGWFEN